MIAIVGDSFCADYNISLTINSQRPHQTYVHSRSWVTDVAYRYKKSVDVHGYGGKSWWYSWSAFQSVWKDRLDELSAIIFCHTNYNRINTANSMLEPTSSVKYQATKKEREHAVDAFYKYLHDEEFQLFAQRQYAKMLNEKFSKIKTLHFFSMVPDQQVALNLPGSVFLTPLTQVAISGINDTRDKISIMINQMGPGKLNNHLTLLSNIALGTFVIEELENYQPGVRPIDMSRFNVQNPNHIHWPDGPWGSNE